MQRINYSTYQKPSDYMKFEQGDNRIRVISEGYMGLQHGLRTSRGWVNLGECTGKGCENCGKGNVPKRYWKWIVANRKLDQAKLLDAGIMIGDAICEIAKKLDAAGEKLTAHDIIVNRVGTERSTKYAIRQAPDDQPITREQLEKWTTEKVYIQTKYLQEVK